MSNYDFFVWLNLKKPETEFRVLLDRVLVWTNDVEEADGLWRARSLLDRPLEIIVGRRYSPSVESQENWKNPRS